MDSSVAEEENPDPSSPPQPAVVGTVKGGKKPKKKERTGRRNREICDVFGDAAMMNAYNISHSVQDFLNYRGFPWGGHKK
ncbi:small lysine-rich protein 1-like [Folsomia candida]|nr:small lysine-rich protein 1-like [Folsomia candida]